MINGAAPFPIMGGFKGVQPLYLDIYSSIRGFSETA